MPLISVLQMTFQVFVKGNYFVAWQQEQGNISPRARAPCLHSGAETEKLSGLVSPQI